MTSTNANDRERLVAHIYFSPFVHESRAMRAINAVVQAGLFDRAVAVGYLEPELAPVEQMSDYLEIHRLRVDFIPFLPRLARRALAWIFWTIQTALLLRKKRPMMIQTHSLAALPAGVLGRWMAKASHIYDAHELETERVGWGALQKRAARFIESNLIRYVDQILVVSRTIGKWYQDKYTVPEPILIRNLPMNVTADNGIINARSLKSSLGIPQEDMLFVYLGALGYGRGIPMILEAFTRLPTSTHFCALGYGEFTGLVKEAASRHKNIHYHPPVAAKEVVGFVRDADVSLCLIEDVCLSYRYCLPNKLFESRLGGLPVLTSNLPEMAAFISDFGGGWTVDLSVDAIVDAINHIDKQQIELIKMSASAVPSWRDEAPVYIDTVRNVMSEKIGKIATI